MKLLKLFLFITINLVITSLKSQTGQNKFKNLKFKHFTTTQGLSQGSVIDIYQDKTGYIWFGTRDGLNKFDGSKFVTFRHNSENTKSLSNSWVTYIFQDSRKNIWIGTKKGLNKYNPKHENFVSYENWTDKESLTKDEIWAITEDENANLYISTSAGLAQINLNTKESHYYTQNKKDTNSITNNATRSIFNSNDGNLWICTTNSIEKFNTLKQSWKHYQYPKGSEQNSNKTNSPKIYADSKKNIWLGYNNGLAKYHPESDTFKTYYHQNEKVTTKQVRTFCEDKFNNIWIGTYDGIVILDTQENKIVQIKHDENNPTSLSQNSIFKILKDKKGDLWIGTWAGGINYFDYSYDVFKHFSVGTVNKKLNYKVISSIVETNSGNLWIGTEGGGLNYYNKTTASFTYFKHKKNDKHSLSSNNVKSLIEDHAGNLWIGTHDGGLNYLNTSKRPYKFEHINFNFDSNLTIENARIIALLEDKNKNIWIGTVSNGLLFYSRKSKKITKLNYSTKSVHAIHQSNDSNYLFIAGSQGLEKINIDTKIISKISLEINNVKNQIYVHSVYQHADSTTWLGTEGEGLISYNPKTKSTYKYGVKEGLPNEVVYGILPDHENNLWLSTNNGISRINLETKKVKNFDEFDGLQGNEFNYGAFLKSKDGTLYFGGTNGLNYFDPSEIIENRFSPNVDIFKMRVSNKPFKTLTEKIDRIELTHKQNDFSFDFTALNFSQANKNEYAYKLEGFDSQWNYIGNKKTATYTNVDEGKYIFKVKASNNDQYWNEKPAGIKVIILPAPWKTVWAYFAYFLIISMITYAIYSFTKIRIKEKNELKKEKINRERIEEVNKLKLKLFTNISHDFRTPLTLIIGPLQRMIEKKMGNDFVQKQHITMQRNANMLLELITQLLDFRKSESGKLELYASYSNIVSFTKEIKMAFDDLAEVKNIKYKFVVTEKEINIWFDKIKMKKILFNLLSNAFKYTEEGSEINIHIKPDNDSLKIKITNFGENIPKKNLPYVFDRYYRSDQDGFKTGSGIGLALTKSLVNLHKGTISVKSSTKKGTCFTVVFQKGDAHLKEDQKTFTTNDTNTLLDDNAIEVKENDRTSLDENLIKEDKQTLLIVDDNIDVRNFVKDIFSSNYKIYDAENGRKAVHLATHKHIDLIISDIMMPVMNGLELCKEIKTNITTSHIPILLLTAKTDSAHQKDGFQFGADAYITKPFDASVLEARVHNLINTRNNLISKFKKDIILSPKKLTITSTDEVFLKKCIQIIEENITDPTFNVDIFTKQMNMSRSVVYRKIKALTNQSITEFIRTIKLKKAGQLIKETKMHISEIAYEVGFSDLKYFRKCFKSQFNELPSNYRNKNAS